MTPSLLKPDHLITNSAPEFRKRTTSQTSIDSFLTPTTNPKRPLRPVFFNPFAKDTPKSKKPLKKTPQSKSPKKRLSKGNTLSDFATMKTPNKNKTMNKIKSSLLLGEAKKILKKSKSLKQMDVRKSLLKKKSIDGVSGLYKERRMSVEELRARRLAEKQNMKEKIKQDRLRRNQELREKKKRERLQQIEWMRPREDLLCDDSKVSIYIII